MKNILNCLKENLKKLKNHDTTKFSIWRIIILYFFVHLLNACTPIYRFNRLVSKHPYLLDKQVFDTIYIRNGERLDTSFIWQEGKDTIFINGIRLQRFRDTFRIYYKERNCTTNIHKTEIKPSKATEKITREETTNFPLLIGLIAIFLLILWKK